MDNNSASLELIPCERCDELIPFGEYQEHINNNCDRHIPTFMINNLLHNQVNLSNMASTSPSLLNLINRIQELQQRLHNLESQPIIHPEQTEQTEHPVVTQNIQQFVNGFVNNIVHQVVSGHNNTENTADENTEGETVMEDENTEDENATEENLNQDYPYLRPPSISSFSSASDNENTNNSTYTENANMDTINEPFIEYDTEYDEPLIQPIQPIQYEEPLIQPIQSTQPLGMLDYTNMIHNLYNNFINTYNPNNDISDSDILDNDTPNNDTPNNDISDSDTYQESINQLTLISAPHPTPQSTPPPQHQPILQIPPLIIPLPIPQPTPPLLPQSNYVYQVDNQLNNYLNETNPNPNNTYQTLSQLSAQIGDVEIGVKNINNISNIIVLNTDEECIICREEFYKNDKMLQINCGHIFCISCSENWFEKRKDCPVCKREFN